VKLLQRLQRNLTPKLSLMVTLAVLLVLLVLGVYFDLFLRSSFLEDTSKRMQHAYVRLSYNLNRLEEGLTDGASFAKTDERLLASMELVNRYQDKSRYNTFLIDEEKKTLALELLNRVKLSLNSDIALFGQDDELIAYAYRSEGRYVLGYLSFSGGKAQIMQRQETESEFRPAELPPTGNITRIHTPYYSNELIADGAVITYHRLEDKLVVKSHQRVADQGAKKPSGHLEISHYLDAASFRQMSKDFDIQISHSFDPHFDVPTPTLDQRQDLENLRASRSGELYVAVMHKATLNGPVYFNVALDRSEHSAVINSHRIRFLILMITAGVGILLLARYVIRRNLELPLQALMGQIQKVEQGVYSPSEPVKTGDELEIISANVNKLALAVQERESSLENARNQQEFLSNHDALTGLPNRRFFAQRMEHALDMVRRNQSELAVFFLDLDQFKLINDTLGHDVGDALLVQISERLQKNVRSTDTLARIGGDEFNVLVERVRDETEVELIVNKYMALFNEPFNCGLHEISTTVSIGVSMYPKDGTDSVSLLKHADLAVYRAKDRGRDTYSFFSEELSQRASLRAEMIHALKGALDDDADQFSLAYQPKVNTTTGKMVAAEALIRWRAPGFGNVPPVQFIPIAEETGQILAIGEWVLRQGCKDLATLNRAGIHLQHLSMNVSNVQLRSGTELGLIIRQAIAANQLDPAQIELEITESYIAKDVGHAVTTLHELRALGVQLAIDDFGTGYSSMSYLQRLPFTRIKIDKSFIDGLPHKHESQSLTRAILGLAKNFNMKTTAEGVETAEQLKFLQDELCDEIQGYFYAKPMPLADLMAYARREA
jgi:diguanylate cyclase (GGDEF)-like protein